MSSLYEYDCKQPKSNLSKNSKIFQIKLEIFFFMHQTPIIQVYRLQNNLCEFKTSPHRFKKLFCIEKKIVSNKIY